jgi:hypothetical protein
MPPRLEDRIDFELLLDSNFPFQPLGFCDPRDGYVRGA